jgi:sugar phosphate isomerase/epimerase
MGMSRAEDWVLLAYRLPRVPSTPRSAVWRKLKRLGVAWLGDGLVALPADARTREQLEWVAEEVADRGGEATLWLGRPLDAKGISVVVGRMTAAVAAEYDAVAAEAAAMRTADAAARRRAAARLRRELHRIQGRDFFTCPQRETARRAVEQLAAADTAGART